MTPTTKADMSREFGPVKGDTPENVIDGATQRARLEDRLGRQADRIYSAFARVRSLLVTNGWCSMQTPLADVVEMLARFAEEGVRHVKLRVPVDWSRAKAVNPHAAELSMSGDSATLDPTDPMSPLHPDNL